VKSEANLHNLQKTDECDQLEGSGGRDGIKGSPGLMEEKGIPGAISANKFSIKVC